MVSVEVQLIKLQWCSALLSFNAGTALQLVRTYSERQVATVICNCSICGVPYVRTYRHSNESQRHIMMYRLFFNFVSLQGIDFIAIFQYAQNQD